PRLAGNDLSVVKTGHVPIENTGLIRKTAEDGLTLLPHKQGVMYAGTEPVFVLSAGLHGNCAAGT
ncbi:MAG: hypothetical protein WAR24_13435, partial [Candidatus Acidiferrales bacterium]